VSLASAGSYANHLSREITVPLLHHPIFSYVISRKILILRNVLLILLLVVLGDYVASEVNCNSEMVSSGPKVTMEHK